MEEQKETPWLRILIVLIPVLALPIYNRAFPPETLNVEVARRSADTAQQKANVSWIRVSEIVNAMSTELSYQREDDKDLKTDIRELKERIRYLERTPNNVVTRKVARLQTAKTLVGPTENLSIYSPDTEEDGVIGPVRADWRPLQLPAVIPLPDK